MGSLCFCTFQMRYMKPWSLNKAIKSVILGSFEAQHTWNQEESRRATCHRVAWTTFWVTSGRRTRYTCRHTAYMLTWPIKYWWKIANVARRDSLSQIYQRNYFKGYWVKWLYWSKVDWVALTVQSIVGCSTFCDLLFTSAKMLSVFKLLFLFIYFSYAV